MMNRILRVLLLLVWMEVGCTLIVIPWSEIWDTNYFLYRYPEIGVFVKNSYLRGAVSGLGVMNILFAIEAFRRRTTPVESNS
jgi:hypothetical protein